MESELFPRSCPPHDDEGQRRIHENGIPQSIVGPCPSPNFCPSIRLRRCKSESRITNNPMQPLKLFHCHAGDHNYHASFPGSNFRRIPRRSSRNIRPCHIPYRPLQSGSSAHTIWMARNETNLTFSTPLKRRVRHAELVSARERRSKCSFQTIYVVR